MRLLCAVLFLAASGTVIAADDAKEAAKKLEGTYEVIDVLIGGKPSPKKDEVESVVIKDGELIIKTGKRDESAKFTLDPSKKPAHIDISPGGEEKVPAIYQTKETDKGLELTIAFRRGKDKERPTDFKGEGKDDMILKLLRKKEK